MASGGYGVARMDGLVIFVQGAVAGDRVLARIVKKKKDYAKANLSRLISPSPDRVKAPCPYHGYCGGCQWQHLKYERQLVYKRELIRDSLTRIGALPEIPIHEIIPSDPIFRYRNKMEFSFSDHRWLLPEEYGEKGKTAEPGLGLHVPGTFYKVLDIQSCLLQRKRGDDILNEVKRFVKKSGVPVYSLKSHKGFWRFLVLRYSTSHDEWMVNLVTSGEGSGSVSALARLLCEKFGNIRTVVNTINTGKAAVATGEKEIILTGNGTIQDRIGPFEFRISSSSFFQTNSSGAERLYSKVAEYADLRGSETVLDLYCGTGTIPIFLSSHAKEVIGMEISESAVLDANMNCRLNNVTNCRFIQGDIRKILSDSGRIPDVLIVDPPRGGMHKDVLAGIIELAVKKMVYVSCNPATMARDMAALSEKYDIKEIQPVDMFPHTYHVEAVAGLVLRKGAQARS